MEPPKFGTLVVVVDKARNLPNRKKIGKQDAYAIVRLGHEVQRTPTDKRAGQVPNWNHEIRFQVPNESENILKISVFNEDSKTPDLIGDCAIDLTALYKKHEYDNWFDLKYKEKPAGELYAELTFYYEGPPKPKAKIELPDPMLYQGPSRPVSSAPYSRQLPTLPSTNAVSAPVRRRTMSPDGREHLSSIQHSNDFLRTSQNGNHTGIYAHQPPIVPLDRNHTASHYSETWDGQRDTRIYALPPGDMRRKSFSSEPQRTLNHDQSLDQSFAALQVHNKQPRRRLMGPRENHVNHHLSSSIGPHQSYNNSSMPISRPVSSMMSGDHIYESSTAYLNAQNFPDVSDDRYSDTVEVQVVDSVLDPRHGSVHELRHSPQIAPDIGSNDDVKQRGQLYHSDTNLYSAQPAMELHCAQLQAHNMHQYDQPFNVRHEAGGIYGDTIGATAKMVHRHGQAQSMSYTSDLYGEQLRRQPPQHNKAASTSVMRADMNYDQRNQYQHPMSTNTLNSRVKSNHIHTANQQNPATYAITPAQHYARERPLPRDPYSPPTLPAKIPLGLTQAEYDILYA